MVMVLLVVLRTERGMPQGRKVLMVIFDVPVHARNEGVLRNPSSEISKEIRGVTVIKQTAIVNGEQLGACDKGRFGGASAAFFLLFTLVLSEKRGFKKRGGEIKNE